MKFSGLSVWIARSALLDLYIGQQQSTKQTAAALAVSPSTVRRFLISYGIPLRTKSEGRVLANPRIVEKLIGRERIFTKATKDRMRESSVKRWEGKAKGTRITSSGYVEYTTGPHKGRLVHDVLMEAKIGRPLAENEVVHHDDEDRQNNADENLILMTRSEHAALHRAREKAKKELEHGFIA